MVGGYTMRDAFLFAFLSKLAAWSLEFGSGFVNGAFETLG